MISFKKKDLLSSNFEQEFLEANQLGACCSSTLNFCNSRKYHGLFSVRMPELDDFNHILLASIEEQVNINGELFNLANRAYPNHIHPQGYQYIKSFKFDKYPTWKYELGNSKLKKEILLSDNDNTLYIRYTNLNKHDEMLMSIFPFTNFRQMHRLTQHNGNANVYTEEVEKGIKVKLYDSYCPMYIQFNHGTRFVSNPQWHYQTEYREELKRGYPFHEDLLVVGGFDFVLYANQSITLAISTKKQNPATIESQLKKEISKRPRIKTMEEALVFSGKQFFSNSPKGKEVTAGFPWFGRWGRDTFIALPGLALAINDPKSIEKVLDTMVADLKDGLFTNIGVGGRAEYNSADASLWFFWTLQEFAKTTSNEKVWEKYGKYMLSILSHYKKGTHYNINMQPNGLLSAGDDGVALTWMDAVINGVPVTPRRGLAVDLNALWYNAICYTLELGTLTKDIPSKMMLEWEKIKGDIEKSFIPTFWIKEKGYLADFVLDGKQDFCLRPNQIFAISLPYSLLNKEEADGILKIVTKNLLTPKGLRTLSPTDPNYIGKYEGGQVQRDLSYHQGTVWPWLLGHYVDALIATYGKKSKKQIQIIWDNFESDMYLYGLLSVAEIYDGNVPHNPKGTTSQAWSVSELLRINQILKELNK